MKLLDILKYTRCHGSSTEAMFINNYLLPKINELGYKPTMDAVGNIWVELASKEDAPYLFVAHIDTCHRGEGLITPIVKGSIVSVNPKDVNTACLGADDGVGIYCNLRMIEAGVGGTYLFTRGEEKGGIGARHIADITPHKLEGFKMAIEVDRAGTDEIIVSQGAGKHASEAFGKQLGDMLGMGHKPSHIGVYTDVAEFGDIIPESVNISAGYERQHTLKETVDLDYVDRLIDKLLLVDWAALTIHREVGDYGTVGWNYCDTPAHDETYHKLVAYVREYPQRVANFLELVGIDEYEMDKEWFDDIDDSPTDDYQESDYLRAGMW